MMNCCELPPPTTTTTTQHRQQDRLKTVTDVNLSHLCYAQRNVLCAHCAYMNMGLSVCARAMIFDRAYSKRDINVMAPHYSCLFTRYALSVCFFFTPVFVREPAVNDDNNVNDTHLACFILFGYNAIVVNGCKPFLISYHFSFRPNYYSLLTFHSGSYFFSRFRSLSPVIRVASYCYLILCL